MGADRVVIIGCVSQKLRKAAPARDLYVSDLFQARRAYAEARGVPWGILSALYEVVPPDRVIRPYNMTIKQALSKKRGGGHGWAIGVIQDCYQIAGHETQVVGTGRNKRRIFPEPLTIEVHAGIDYVRAIEELGVPMFDECANIHIEHPVAGMGIGEQKHFYRVKCAEMYLRTAAGLSPVGRGK